MSDALARIAQMVQLIDEKTKRIAALNVELESEVEALTRLERRDLPDLMNELQLSEVKLLDGTSVKIVDDLSCGITEANRAAALEWLKEHGFGGLIKAQVTATFGREDSELAEAAMAALSERLSGAGIQPEMKETVHPATLKSFVKERMNAGDNIPTDLFSVYCYSRAKITKPRAR